MSTIDFIAARRNMVISQLEPNGIISQHLLEAFTNTPREAFVGAEWQSVCYCDQDIPLPENRTLLAPMVLAKMLQAANIHASETVLVIGGATGYSAAILAGLANNVYLLEESALLLNAAQEALNALNKPNVVLGQGALPDGLPRHAPYNVILIEGAVAQVPSHILSQLAENGRLIAIESNIKGRMGQAVEYQKTASGAYSRAVLFDSAADELPGGWKAESFAL